MNLPPSSILALALELCSRTVVLSHGQIVYDGSTEAIMSDADRLEAYSLELPLSYSRPYCQLAHAPAA